MKNFTHSNKQPRLDGMKQNTLNLSVRLRECSLRISLRQLMNNYRSAQTIRHNSREVISLSMPSDLLNFLKVIYDNPHAILVFVLGNFRTPLNSCFDFLIFNSITNWRFRENVVGLFRA